MASKVESNINDLMGQFGFGGMGRQQMRKPRYPIGCRITIQKYILVRMLLQHIGLTTEKNKQ